MGGDQGFEEEEEERRRGRMKKKGDREEGEEGWATSAILPI